MLSGLEFKRVLLLNDQSYSTAFSLVDVLFVKTIGFMREKRVECCGLNALTLLPTLKMLPRKKDRSVIIRLFSIFFSSG